jgi:hypothetical protein
MTFVSSRLSVIWAGKAEKIGNSSGGLSLLGTCNGCSAQTIKGLMASKSPGMDFSRTIEQLRREKEKLERAIASLEDLQAAVPKTTPERPLTGRRFIGAEERREISERMKRYWSNRRNKGQAG